MQDLDQALVAVKQLFQELTGQPAPHLPPYLYRPFPPGADPVQHTLMETSHLMRAAEQARLAPTPIAWVPRADVFVSTDVVVIRLEVAGVARADLQVGIAGGECIVRGERKAPDGNLQPITLERPYGPFERRFPLPASSHPEQVSAHHRDGELEIRIKVDAARGSKEMKIDVE